MGHWSLERDVAVALQEVCEDRGIGCTCGMGVLQHSSAGLMFGYVIALCAARA